MPWSDPNSEILADKTGRSLFRNIGEFPEGTGLSPSHVGQSQVCPGEILDAPRTGVSLENGAPSATDSPRTLTRRFARTFLIGPSCACGGNEQTTPGIHRPSPARVAGSGERGFPSGCGKIPAPRVRSSTCLIGGILHD